MSGRRGLELHRTRALGALFADATALYLRELPAFIAISVAVVVPVELVVSGLGLEQLFSHYDSAPPAGEQALQIAVAYVLTTPLVTAMAAHAMLGIAANRGPTPGRAIAAGLEAFPSLFGAMLLAAAGVALGLLAFLLPGIYLGVRWYLVPQAVVVDGAAGLAALRRSGKLVQGSWWRVLAVGLLSGAAAVVPGVLLQIPFTVAAEAANAQALVLAGAIAAETITTPFVAIVGTLLYFDLRERLRADYRP